MLKCQEVAHEATNYIEKSQTQSRHISMWFHLLICHNCRRFVKHLILVRDFSRRKSYITTNKEKTEMIMKTIKESIDKKE